MIAMALATLLFYAGGPALAYVPATATISYHQTPEAGLTGPVTTGTPAGCPAQAGSLTGAEAAVPT